MGDHDDAADYAGLDPDLLAWNPAEFPTVMHHRPSATRRGPS
jgi:hypothetical protein